MAQEYNRRDFLGLAGSGIAAAIGNFSVAGPARADETDPRKADLVVVNGNVYTVDPQMAKAEAFAVKGDRCLAVGSSDAMRAFVGKGTTILDARQMTIVPGFIDCHNHAPGNE